MKNRIHGFASFLKVTKNGDSAQSCFDRWTSSSMQFCFLFDVVLAWNASPPDGATRESMASYAELRADYYFRRAQRVATRAASSPAHASQALLLAHAAADLVENRTLAEASHRLIRKLKPKLSAPSWTPTEAEPSGGKCTSASCSSPPDAHSFFGSLVGTTSLADLKVSASPGS